MKGELSENEKWIRGIWSGSLIFICFNYYTGSDRNDNINLA